MKWHYAIIRPDDHTPDGWALIAYGFSMRHGPVGQAAVMRRRNERAYRVVAYPAGTYVGEVID